LSTEPGARRASSGRVWVATADEQDIGPYRRAVAASRARLARWNPVDPDDLARSLPLQSRNRRTFLIHAVHPEGEHDIVGKINVSDAVRGRFESAALGYDAYDPYSGRGLFSEGLRLLVDLLFTPEDAGGMGLHRVQAAVQPGNVRSAGLLRSLGFQREGFSPRMLWLPGADGREGWQDHDSYVVMADQWPAEPYAEPPDRAIVALVNGAPGSGAGAVARQLAAELRVPLFCQETVTTSGHQGPWALLADSPVGGVVQGSIWPGDAGSVVDGLRGCGLDPARVPEIWCLSDQDGGPRLLGLGPAVVLPAHPAPGRADLVRLALQVGAGFVSASET
jgi:[ribosomal protein S5]-alanine N-acetyltransferase